MSKVLEKRHEIHEYLSAFIYGETNDLFGPSCQNTSVEYLEINGRNYPKYINEFWTAKQRQANSIHEIAYRACFKPQLPRFFIELFTEPKDMVYDPFSGRGTTVIEAALLDRNVIANDINPLSEILTRPRLFIPNIAQLKRRLEEIPIDAKARADIDISMFYHPKTEAEIVSLKRYLEKKHNEGGEDEIDSWIRMVATNRLSGHSTGFFSVYTLPPNQAVSQESQRKINENRGQTPDYRDTLKIIIRKTESLLKDLNPGLIKRLRAVGERAVFLAEDARWTSRINDNTIQLTVTSPPFLDVVQYADDNWLRCWFNSIDPFGVGGKITTSKKTDQWCEVMVKVFDELFRITKSGGHVAFEVGEVKGGNIKLEEYVAPLGIKSGFSFECIMINEQEFTKTANIWGIKNNKKGTNTNRIVIFRKP